MDICLFCHGTLDPTTRRCQQCGQAQPAWVGAPTIPAAAPAAATPQTQRCLSCGGEVPAWMRYCGYCGRSLPELAGPAPDGGSPVFAPVMPASPEGANAPAPGAAQPLLDQADAPLPASGPGARAPGGSPPVLVPSMSAPAPGVAGPGIQHVPPTPQRVPLGKKIIALVTVAVLAILITVAFAQASAFLHRAASTSSSARPTTTPHLSAGAPGTISEVPLPTKGVNTLGGITAGPDGNVWFIEGNAGHTIQQIGRITPQGAITEFPVSNLAGDLRDIVAGPDGNLWFTEDDDQQIGRITPAGEVSLLSLPTDGHGIPEGIAAGPDGNLWISDDLQILRLTPGGRLTIFPLPGSDSADYVAWGITAGPDGNLWFPISTLVGARGLIGRITPHGVITEFPLPPSGEWKQVTRIARGADGNLWFNELDYDTAGQIGRMTPQGVFTPFSLAQGSLALDIASGPDGNLWVAAGTAMERVTPAGQLSTFPLPNADRFAAAMTAGPDGSVWFTDTGRNGQAPMIGRVIVGK